MPWPWAFGPLTVMPLLRGPSVEDVSVKTLEAVLTPPEPLYPTALATLVAVTVVAASRVVVLREQEPTPLTILHSLTVVLPTLA